MNDAAGVLVQHAEIDDDDGSRHVSRHAAARKVGCQMQPGLTAVKTTVQIQKINIQQAHKLPLPIIATTLPTAENTFQRNSIAQVAS
jgi:hypothetical protein